MPAHLVSNVKQPLNTEVLAEGEEEEESEEEEEEEEDEREVSVAELDCSVRRGEDVQLTQSKDVRTMTSWTTFAVESMQADNLVDEMAAAAAARGGLGGSSEPKAAPASADGKQQPASEDLPSYKVMQALQTAAGRLDGQAAEPPRTSGQSPAAGEASGSAARALQHPVPPSPLGKAVAANGGPLTTPSGATPLTQALDAAARANGGAATASSSTAAAAATAAAARPPGAAAAASPRPGAQGPTPQPPATDVAGVMSTTEEDEWEAANRERRREMGLALGAEGMGLASSGGGSAAPAPSAATPLTYPEALMHFMAMDVSATRGSVAAALPPPPGLLARLLCLGPPDLRPPLLREQLLQLLCLAKLNFDDADVMHVRLLGSVYAAFTGKSPDQPRLGSHWADLGFQGQDPATDLRGCGMLGLVQLFSLPHWNAEGAHKMYVLSHHPVHEFPLAIVSLNVTKWTLQALRSGGLHRAANARGSTLEAAQLFYAGGMASFYAAWVRGAKTMRDSGHVLRELEILATKKPGLMLEAAERPDLPDPPAP